MIESNIIDISLLSNKKQSTSPIHQWDTGIKLRFDSNLLTIDSTCQFEAFEETINQLIVDGMCDVPNSLLGEYFNGDIYAHVYVPHTNNAMTVYDIRIPVLPRQKPADHVSPDNEQTIEEWIEEQVEAVADDKAAIEAMSATASVENDGGDPEVEVTKTVTDHVNLDFAFKNVIGRKGDPGADGVTPSFSIGTVSSVDPMYPPYVTITGTDANPVLNFGLPKGNSGMGVELRNVNVLTDSGATRGTVTAVSAVPGKTTYDINLYNIKGDKGDDGKAGDSFNDANVYTDAGATRVELTVVAVGLDGSKTYDVDFYNIGGGSDLPEIESGDAGKVVAVNNDEDGYELVNQSGGLPAVTSSDEGKALMVDSNGDWVADDIPTELPAVSAVDNGMVLGVSSGAWAKVSAPSGLPAATSADEGKLLGVDSNGDWGKTNPFAEETWTFTLLDNSTVTKTLLVKVVSL